MNISVSQIYQAKIQEIESRIPVSLDSPSGVSFADTLSSLTYSPKSTTSSDTSATMDQINSAIDTYAEKYDVNPNLIRAIIKQESNFNTSAYSSAGAQGLMQLMPGTAAGLGVNPWSINGNIEGGTKYIKQQLDKFGSLELALAAYNAGPGAVSKYGGIPPYNETQNYVQKVIGYFNDYEES